MFRSALIAAALGTGAVGGAAVAAMPADAPMTWFVTCSADAFDHSVTGGRVIVGAEGYRSELIGPVAATREGAVRAAGEFGPLFASGPAYDIGAECEPTHASEIWTVGVPLCAPERAAAGHAPAFGC